MSKQLRYYQIEAKEAVLNALKRGIKKQMIVMPGGTGKTVTAANIIKDFGRKLWVNHEESLLEQSLIVLLDEYNILEEKRSITACAKHGGLIELIYAGKKGNLHSEDERTIYNNVGIIKEDLFEINKPIVGASPQTLWKRLDKIPLDHFGATVYDEGDLFGSATFKMPIETLKPELVLSMTATPFRFDGVLMEDVFDEIVYEYKIEQAIKDKFLTELNSIIINTNIDLDSVGTMAGDFNKQQLTAKVNVPERNNLIVNKYIEYCSGQQFICFGADVQHVIDLHEAFEMKGIKTSYVVSDKDRMIIGTDRKQIVSQYRKGDILGLINYNIFGAGFDHKDCGAVILACPTKSKRKLLQQLFRVTRLKTQGFVDRFGQIGTILDILDMTSKHVLVNTKTLDQGLPIEERVFVSRKNKDLLLAAKKEREFQLTLRKEDKKIELFKIPKVKAIVSKRMVEPATEAQLNVLKGLNYDIDNVTYTKGMAHDIIGQLTLSQKKLKELVDLGYETKDRVLTYNDYSAAMFDYKKRTEAKEKQKELEKFRKKHYKPLN